MIFSMTGYGAAQLVQGSLSVHVEVRSVNNRHLKINIRGTEPYPLLDSDFEKIVRPQVRRGSLLIQVKVQRPASPEAVNLNTTAIECYLAQLRRVVPQAEPGELLAAVLSLPGVANEPTTWLTPPADEWPLVELALSSALRELNQAREAEGAAMAGELLRLLDHMQNRLDAVVELLPTIVTDYRQRLLERVQQTVQQAGVTLKPEDVIREVALYADRTDVAEEVTRLKHHFEQYRELIESNMDTAGRRLEFIVQEMGREVNTLGSKAGSASISRQVVDMKATLEKIRELIQNVE